jgi:hypothetical protein
MNNKNWDFLQSTVAHVTEVETAKRRGPKQFVPLLSPLTFCSISSLDLC